MFNFFLCELPLILTVSVKLKNEQNGHICKGILDIEFEQDCSFGLGATLGDIHTDFFFFSVLGIFLEKPIVSYCWVWYTF